MQRCLNGSNGLPGKGCWGNNAEFVQVGLIRWSDSGVFQVKGAYAAKDNSAFCIFKGEKIKRS